MLAICEFDIVLPWEFVDHAAFLLLKPLKTLLAEYAQTGIDKYFQLTVVNNDPGSEQGAQTVFYQDCRLVSIQPSKADVDSDVLEEDIEINFGGMEYGGNFADNTI